MGFLSRHDLEGTGLAAIGSDVLISDKASIHGASRISLGSHVRIDDFCILSATAGPFTIGSRVHIACLTTLIGRAPIILSDFANLSSRVTVYSSTDDFSGEWMTSPMVPEQYTNVRSEKVMVGRHVVIGAGTVILPGVELGEGSAVGALSLVKSRVPPFMIYAGTPARPVGKRSNRLVELERRFALEQPPI